MNNTARPLRCMKPLFVASLIIFTPLTAQAAGLVSPTPGAGSILQQINPVEPPAPLSTGTGLFIEQQGGGTLPPSAPFEVKSIQISGNTLFDTPTLHALVADTEGKTLTLSALDELATRITDYYHNHGYPLARAFIPAQTIRAGVVRIEVIEARYGKVKLDNRSMTNNPVLEATLSALQSGQPIEQTAMDRVLLLLSDIPGIEIGATLIPGETVGTSDLAVVATPGPAVSGNLTADDYGSRYTGKARAGGTVNLNNLSHRGDYFSFSGLTSGSGMNYERIAYDDLLNGAGTRMGGSYSAMHYVLGDTLGPINGHGTAQVGSMWLKHPFKRSREVNLYGHIQYDEMILHDHIDSTGIQTDRHLNNWTATLSGDSRDALLSGAINTWSLSGTSGRVNFDALAAQLADAATAKTQGSFSKWNASFSRQQGLNQKNSLYLIFAAQGANGNLDSSQKMAVGGPYSVRAYDMGAVSGDTGYLLTAEFRRDLGQFGRGRWQAVAFVDNAQVTINKSVWVAGTNSATLTGAGLGFTWVVPDQWSVKTYVAAPIGSTPVQTTSARAWIEISKGF